MNIRPEIDKFLSSKTIAVAGVSRNKNKFGSVVYRDLKQKGYNVIPLNPNCDQIEGDKCYRDISELPEETEGLLCVVKPEVTEKLVQEVESRGIRSIWLQQGSESKRAIEFCEANSISLISKACILMYADPVQSFHKFHRGLAKLFGRYHK